MLAIIMYEQHIPNALETYISLTSRRIFIYVDVKTTQVIRVLSLHRTEVRFETSFSLAVLSKTTNVRVCGTIPSFHRWREHSREERGCHSVVRNRLKGLEMSPW